MLFVESSFKKVLESFFFFLVPQPWMDPPSMAKFNLSSLF
jgi:hypothetical protein